MTVPVTIERWREVRDALRHNGDRLVRLLMSVHSPEVAAVGKWTLSETAAHVTAVASLYNTLLAAEARPHPIPGIENRVRAAALTDIGAVNDHTLIHLTERDPVVLAERLRGELGQLLDMAETLDPNRSVAWLGSAQLPISGWFAHLLNELLLHGHDIATAAGEPWVIRPGDGAMAFEMFLVTLLGGDTGKLLRDEPIPRSRIAFRFRSRHTAPVVFAVQDGRFAVEPEGGGAIDGTVYFAPDALMLILFNRLGKPRAALTGRVAVWGRRPWLLPAFLKAVRLP